ncbi:hypothetical protein, variant [Cryptococcus amylolentus CBS 6039]|uniref:Uncharacterized protein n=1 Tax=Cryptococcus amylolentus CBS 6039 TaxID=1295533 RepID=A0A1E3HVR2_9TREE|nr:hypothetical protein, variant [Cryptococcus amylolentus CBS 6039]ODN80409.1 hypothetical protein, variant [Cryptococcus amylolentus CBS 6039]
MAQRLPPLAALDPRFEYHPGPPIHPTSSLRDPPKGATGSPDVGEREGENQRQLSHQPPTPVTANSTVGKPAQPVKVARGRRKKDAQENAEEDDAQGGKRRKLTKPKPSPLTVQPPDSHSPSKDSGPSTGESSVSVGRSVASGGLQQQQQGLPKPMGFAAAREARREEGYDVYGMVPSPVVMGFDFKSVEGEQLKTVRESLSIKEQQQALIAARRREAEVAANSNPSTPRDPSMVPAHPQKTGPDPSMTLAVPTSGSVGKRREKVKDKVDKMTIVTGTAGKDAVPGSRSAPLNQNLAIQQSVPRDIPSGSRTALPPNALPSFSSSFQHFSTDPRTAPISHARGNGMQDRGEGAEFARQQGYYWRLDGGRGPGHANGANGSGSRPSVVPDEGRRNFTVPSIALPRLEGQMSPVKSRNTSGAPHSVPISRNHSHQSISHSQSTSPRSQPPPPAAPIPSREAFLNPFASLYDSLSQTTHLQSTLNSLLHSSENLTAQQARQMEEFKSTMSMANGLLGSLQSSADSLREMVRYEVERRGREDRREMEEMKERLRRLEEERR